MAIRAILSDLGRVVTAFDNTLSAKRLSKYSPHSVAAIEQDLFRSEDSLYLQFERGVFPEAFFLRRTRHLFDIKSTCTNKQIRKALQEGLVPIDSVLQLWRELRETQGMILTAVSNIDPIRWARLVEHGFPEAFDHLTLSFQVRARKPSEQIFQDALQRSGVEPHEAFFIDDVPEYVDAARRLGIHAYVQKVQGDTEGIRRALRELGVSV